jgi:hypothetical protein
VGEVLLDGKVAQHGVLLGYKSNVGSIVGDGVQLSIYIDLAARVAHAI